jgi:Na+-transporting NADH:ubiquinone oxidoreductase subunit NqrA
MLQLSQYSSVDLLKESSIRCLCEIIKAEVTRSFEEGPPLAKHLALDSATFLKSTSSELAVLISSKDKLRGRWRVLQHDSLSLQQQLTSEFTKKRNIAQDSDDFELESREILDLDEYEMLTGQRQVLLENLKSKFDQVLLDMLTDCYISQ